MVDANGRLRFLKPDGTPLQLAMSGITTDDFAYQIPVGNGRQFYPGNTATASSVTLLDGSTGLPTTELIINEGNTIRPRLRIVDSAGAVRDDFDAAILSLNQAVATVDATGTIRGQSAGFSTLTINISGVVATATATVVKVDSGVSGYNVVGVAQDLAQRLYLASPQDHIILQLDDLAQAPVPYAGMQNNPGLRNALRLEDPTSRDEHCYACH
jgi:hypothetical protein